MQYFLTNLIVPMVVFVIAISFSVLIAYLLTGDQIGEFEDLYTLDIFVLVVGFVFQCLFKDDQFASAVISDTLGLTFFVVAILIEKRGCNGLAFGKLPEGTGARAGCKGLGLMLLNASVIVPLCLLFSWAFQTVNYYGEYVRGYVLILLCSTLMSLAAISFSVLIAYLFTGEQIGEPGEPYVLGLFGLVIGFALQYICRDCAYIPTLAQNAVNIVIIVITFLDKSGPQRLHSLTSEPPGMLLNALVVVFLGYIASGLFQYILDGQEFINWLNIARSA